MNLHGGISRVVSSVLPRYDPEALEAQTSLAAMCAGLWFGWMNTPLPTVPPSLYAEAGVCRFWGAALILLGGAQAVALWSKRMRWRAASAMIGVGLWSGATVLLLGGAAAGRGSDGPSANLAGALFPLIALSEAWVYLRLRTGTAASIEASAQAAESPPSRRVL